MTAVREPAVAGLFYPGSAEQLRETVSGLLAAAACDTGDPPKALIVPHAGYVYSGPVAASGYARIARHRDRYERVVLIGPSHRVPLGGLALPSADAFRTPLGDVRLDKAWAAGRCDRLIEFDAAHRGEHSLEVHVPFLQMLLGDFKLVPVVVGDARARDVADALDELWGGEETLVVVSTDLSHYLGYDRASETDRVTAEAIERFDAAAVGHDRACGATPLGGLLIQARRHGLEIERVDLRNSGDTAGDPRRVVGYGAWVLRSGSSSALRLKENER